MAPGGGARRGFLLGVALAFGFVSTAAADENLDSAVAAFDEADFDGALAAFARAEASDGLTREELEQLFARRAGVHLALGDEEGARRDLEALATLSPNFVFGPWAPPSLRERFEQSRGTASRITLTVTTAEVPDGRRFEGAADGAPEGLVRELRIHVRSIGGPWTQLRSGETATGDAFDYYAEAIGPGGVVLARVADRDEPRRVGALPRATGPMVADEDDDERGWLWWVVGAAAVVVVGVVIGVAVAVGGGDDGSTKIEPPMLRF